ncbi:MAG: dephospho-CoA kinase, CoaE [Nitrosarchaeum sp.]|nr:dephospho-CoA kinase, CoaE [Nitrosarchaeum sp.]
MPGAGKSTIADGLKSKGYDIINMGNAVRAEAKNRNLEPTGHNLGKKWSRCNSRISCTTN